MNSVLRRAILPLAECRELDLERAALLGVDHRQVSDHAAQPGREVLVRSTILGRQPRGLGVGKANALRLAAPRIRCERQICG